MLAGNFRFGYYIHAMKNRVKNIFCAILAIVTLSYFGGIAQAEPETKSRSGNPILPGWYADPEAIIYGDTYWIYPTYSSDFDRQTFFDCFSCIHAASYRCDATNTMIYFITE